ncbi:MFS transporter [Candidatus Parcubacteria bacterium]|nr:MFS transporter [Candidatus Parcubacteria bacterium]
MLKKLKVNKIIGHLILADVLFWSGWGLFSPVFAIFLTKNIEGGNLALVGLASGIYWILKSLLRVPIGILLDSRKGEEDDFWFLFFGLIFSSLVPFGYLIARVFWHIILLQILQAFGMAMALSGWTAIFTRHIDSGKEATEWGLDATLVGLGIGFSGIFGGLIAEVLGFKTLFVLVGILGFLASFSLFGILKIISPRSLKKGLIFSLREVFFQEK